MAKEWMLPHDPELLYLRERVKRLEAELKYRRNDDHSISQPPATLALQNKTLPISHLILKPLVTVTADAEPGQQHYHIVLRAGSGVDSVGYGYYVTNQELYSVPDLCGLMAHLHERTVYTLARFIEKGAKEGKGKI